MSAFSKGCFLQQRLFARPMQMQLSPLNSCQSRFFTTSQVLYKSKFRYTASKTGPTSLNPSISKKVPGIGISAKGAVVSKVPNAAPIAFANVRPPLYVESLAQKSGPSIIYTAPPHTRLFIVCYAGTTLIMAQAAYFLYIYLVPHEGLMWFIPYIFGLGGMLAAGLGTWMFLGTSAIIRKITAVPKKVKGISPITRMPAKPTVELEVEIRKMVPIPFWPARKLFISPNEFKLSNPVYQRMESERSAYQRNQELWIVKRALNAFWADQKKFWTRDGFEKVRIDGRSYKLDVTGNHASDVGLALDKLDRAGR